MVWAQDIPSVNRLLLSAKHLINRGLRNQHIPVFISGKAFRSIEVKVIVVGTSAWVKNKIISQVEMFSVRGKVNPGVNPAVNDIGIGRNSRTPMRSIPPNKVIDGA